jgi:outer membrane protein TolC
VILFRLFLSFQLASADVSETEIVKHVLSTLPTVQMAQDDVSISKAEEKFAEGAFDIFLQGQYSNLEGDYNYDFLQTQIVKPTAIFGLDLYAGFRKSDGIIPVYDGQLDTLSDGEFNFGFKLPLLRGFMIDERRALLSKNKLVVKQRQYQLFATELEQVRLSLHRFWDWRLSAQRFAINRDLLTIAKLRDQWLAKRMKAGDVAKFERDDNQRTILLRESLLLQAEQTLNQTLAELEFYIDDKDIRRRLETTASEKIDFVMPEDISKYTGKPDSLVDLAFVNRPEFKALNLQKDQLKIDGELQANRFLPRLDVEGQFSRDRGQGSSTLDEDNAKISLQLEIPLQYRRIRGREEQIEGSISRVNNQYRAMLQRIRADIVTTQKNLSVSLQRRSLAEQELKLARVLEDGERKRLRQGETNILIVNLREQATAEANFRYAEASVEAIKHFITLKTAIGELPSPR